MVLFFILCFSSQFVHADNSQFQGNLAQWKTLTEQQKQEYRQRLQDFKHLPPELREEILKRHNFILENFLQCKEEGFVRIGKNLKR